MSDRIAVGDRIGRFQGLTVILTGATGGFGHRAAERFAAEGARLVLSDIEVGPLDKMAQSLDTDCAILAGDIADETLSSSLVELALTRFGKLDIAVNNAGVAQGLKRLPQTPSEEARRIIEVDLMGVFYALKHQIPGHGREPENGPRRRHSQHRFRFRSAGRCTTFGLLGSKTWRCWPDPLRCS